MCNAIRKAVYCVMLAWSIQHRNLTDGRYYAGCCLMMGFPKNRFHCEWSVTSRGLRPLTHFMTKGVLFVSYYFDSSINCKVKFLKRLEVEGAWSPGRVYTTYCLQEVPGQVIGTVVTCNGVYCDNVIPGTTRGGGGCWLRGWGSQQVHDGKY